jgi:hypothetical protein
MIIMLKYFFTTFFFTSLLVHKSNVERVSIISLIATPERYDKKWVAVKGFFVNEFENRVLFLDRNSAKKNIVENGITLIFDSISKINMLNKYQNQYLEIEGLFNKAKDNNKNTFNHYVSKIYNIRLIK